VKSVKQKCLIKMLPDRRWYFGGLKVLMGKMTSVAAFIHICAVVYRTLPAELRISTKLKILH